MRAELARLQDCEVLHVWRNAADHEKLTDMERLAFVELQRRNIPTPPPGESA